MIARAEAAALSELGPRLSTANGAASERRRSASYDAPRDSELGADDDAARVLSLMLVFHSAAPLFAPSIGAALTVAYGWEAMFVFLSVYSLSVAIFFSAVFRETIAEKALDALKAGHLP